MLRFEKVRLRQGTFVLDAHFAIKHGAKVAIIGPSGGGKSTLLSAVAGFVEPEEGEILSDGTTITHLPPGERPVSLLFQDNNLFPHLNVEQNVGLGVRPDLKLDAKDWAAVSKVLEQVGLHDQGRKLPAALSGGQQQRVALARVLLRDRPILLLDEPFGALGPALKAEMLDLVEDIVTQSQTTMLMVTHDPEDAKRISDETILVADGIAHAPAPTADLFTNPPPALADYLG